MYWLYKKLKKFYYTQIRHVRMVTVHVSGRLKPQDKKFLAHHGDKYIKKLPAVLEAVRSAQQADRRVILEIGFGNGQHLLPLAERNIDALVVGVELYFVGLVLAAKKMFQNSIANTVLTKSDARDVLDGLPADILSECYILFPDPWRKAKHNKRRLVKYPFMRDVMSRVMVGGVCYVATDWAEYADEINEVMEQLSHEEVIEVVRYDVSVGDFTATVPEISPILGTAFAQRAQREGRDVAVFIAKKV
jgi:tRNA (guanine-N(7)-)-methyltransferase